MQSKSIFLELVNIGLKNASKERPNNTQGVFEVEVQNARHAAIELLLNLWLNFEYTFSDREYYDTAKDILLAFRRASRSNQISLTLLGLSVQWFSCTRP